MSNPRLVWYAGILLAILVLGYGLAVAGLALCAPPPLPGDAQWVWTTRFGQAFAIVLGQPESCFLRSGTGAWALAVAARSGLALVAIVTIALLWELAGRPLRRQLWRGRGGHAILAGEPGEIEALATALGQGSPAFVARNAIAAQSIGRARPFSDVTVLGDRRGARQEMARLGGDKARFVVAATDNDLTNGELAEAALADAGKGEVLVRLEQSSVRALKSDVLRRTAEQRRRGLTVVSLRQMQARQALQLAMPGRYIHPGRKRVHIALCGAGGMMQEAAFLLARQGYGLETAPPLLSIMRTGHRDFGAGALERLVAAEAIEVHPVSADGQSAVDIDRTFTAIALGSVPLTAIHCCEDDEGSALALALRLERVVADLKLPVPPIVVHGAGPDSPGDTGMVRVAPALTLAEARAHAALIDQRAMAFHACYLDGQRKARGAEFGTLPAELDWSVLPEQFRDDNRNAADHIDYKLAHAGLLPARRPEGADLSDFEIETLAAIEHARWMASKSVSGTRYGPTRDNALMLHPDMKPYDQLDEDAKRKDRELVALVPVQLAAAGEVLLRLRAFRILSANGIERALALLAQAVTANPEQQPIVVADLRKADGIAVAEHALHAGIPIEVWVSAAAEEMHDDASLRRRAAAILRQAWRIQAVSAAATAETAGLGYPVLVDAEGRINEAAVE